MDPVLAVIPARYQSSRFPGKPMAEILGLPMIHHVYNSVKSSNCFDEVVVATDHDGILTYCNSKGLNCKMTDPNLQSGTDRVWAVAEDIDCSLIVNVQGDEPLMSKDALQAIVSDMRNKPDYSMWTLSTALTEEGRNDFDTVKVLTNDNSDAIYFSRFAIPFSRNQDTEVTSVHKHLGIYGFRKDFLKQYCEHSPVGIEKAEGLEQLRALQMGVRIAVQKVDYDSIGVDRPEDIQKVENILRSRS